MEMASHGLDTKQVKFGLQRSIYDGIFATMFATLTGGVFLTGFALALGANQFQIGLIAALPLLANGAQLFGSYLVQKTRSRKGVAIHGAALSRALWIPIVLSPLTFWGGTTSERLWFILGALAVSSFLGSISGVSWLSWMTDLVPEHIRGRYFGRRNMTNGIVVMTLSLLGGKLLDLLGDGIARFQLLFLIALVAGAVSLHFLRQIAEPAFPHPVSEKPFASLLPLPWKDANFRRLIRFTTLWGFAVNFAAPFFAVYMLEDLKLSFGLIALYAASSSLMDMLGMRFWGVLSDRVGNKPVMVLTSFFGAAVPVVWLFTFRNALSLYLLLPVVHVMAGFFWAGFNLCSANMLLRLAPRETNSVYFAVYAAFNGVAAAVASVAGGMAGKLVAEWQLTIPGLEFRGLKIIFLISALLRFSAIPLLRRVQEPKEVPLTHAIWVIRTMQPMSTLVGFPPFFQLLSESVEKSKEVFRNGLDALEEVFKVDNWFRRLRQRKQRLRQVPARPGASTKNQK